MSADYEVHSSWGACQMYTILHFWQGYTALSQSINCEWAAAYASLKSSDLAMDGTYKYVLAVCKIEM